MVCAELPVTTMSDYKALFKAAKAQRGAAGPTKLVRGLPKQNQLLYSGVQTNT